MSRAMDEYSGPISPETAWLVPLFFAALLMWPTAMAWWRVAQRRETQGDKIQLLAVDLRRAASYTTLTAGLLAISLSVYLVLYLF